MTPEELRGKVADELRRIDPATYEQDAAAAIRVVLEAVADDLVAESDKFARPVIAHRVGCTCSNCVAAEALNDAADRVRSMTGDPK